jgi:hypothetical protein
VTLRDLLKWISENPEITLDSELWIETGRGLSSEVHFVYRLNKGDIILESNKWKR